MPEYLAPGVYVEEIEIGAKPIEGVSTSTAGFLGETERGPTEPRFIGGLEDYRRQFGAVSWRTDGKPTTSMLPYALEGFFKNGGKRCYVGRIVGDGAATAKLALKGKNGKSAAASQGDDKSKTADDKSKSGGDGGNTARGGRGGGNPDGALTVYAIGPGEWGNRIRVQVSDAANSDQFPELFKLTVTYFSAQDLPVLQEDYDELSPSPESPRYFAKLINNSSTLITVEPHEEGERPANIGTADKPQPLGDGKDGQAPRLRDYTGSSDEPGARTGLLAFKEIDEISIVCVPNEGDVEGLRPEVVAHCVGMQDRFAILQAPRGARRVGDLSPKDARGNRIDTKYAAFYAPWLKIVDPATGMVKDVPPGGHIAGIYARTDNQRGVHKAPANEPLLGVVGLEHTFTTADQDILNPRGVNLIRAFPNRGIRVWGARTVSSDPLWKYVNVRRLFLYIEESIAEGTQWVVFEPNDHRLWARVRQSVGDFLTATWRSGALMGRTPEEAFFVKCDETTMTKNDIANGRLIVVIGVAPVRPAEFVIFRLAQWSKGSELSE